MVLYRIMYYIALRVVISIAIQYSVKGCTELCAIYLALRVLLCSIWILVKILLVSHSFDIIFL